jgi:hypothetical protein
VTSRGPFGTFAVETCPWRSLSVPLETQTNPPDENGFSEISFRPLRDQLRTSQRSVSNSGVGKKNFQTPEVGFGLLRSKPDLGGHFRYLWRRKTNPPDMENGPSEISFGPPGFRVRTSILPKNGTEKVNTFLFSFFSKDSIHKFHY